VAERLEALARRYRRDNNIFTTIVHESARLLNGRMILTGRQNHTQNNIASSALSVHPLTAVLGDLLEITRSLTESVSILVYLSTDCLVLYTNALL
jgi:hypothetical protein